MFTSNFGVVHRYLSLSLSEWIQEKFSTFFISFFYCWWTSFISSICQAYNFSLPLHHCVVYCLLSLSLSNRLGRNTGWTSGFGHQMFSTIIILFLFFFFFCFHSGTHLLLFPFPWYRWRLMKNFFVLVCEIIIIKSATCICLNCFQTRKTNFLGIRKRALQCRFPRLLKSSKR